MPTTFACTHCGTISCDTAGRPLHQPGCPASGVVMGTVVPAPGLPEPRLPTLDGARVLRTVPDLELTRRMRAVPACRDCESTHTALHREHPPDTMYEPARALSRASGCGDCTRLVALEVLRWARVIPDPLEVR